MAHKQITWTKAKRDRLRLAYEQAVKDGKDIFTFEGDEFVTNYAKYLLQYLDGQLGGTNGNGT